MEDALPLFALAAVGCSLALVIWIGGRVWLRAKELERARPPSLDGNTAELTAVLAQIDARLGLLEQSVDATAVEVERLAEAQRFVARSLAAGDAAPSDRGAPTVAPPMTR